MPPQTLLGRRPRGPPCINTGGCKDVNTSGGQWTYITKEFAEKAGVDPDSCHCKRANCREFSGVKDPPLKPWGKRTAAMALGSPINATRLEPNLPRPPFLTAIIAIWGER
jgi:hypothetical protein